MLKAVDDHAGYAIPWDPFQLVTGQTALFHDVHHQGWGIKVRSVNGEPCSFLLFLFLGGVYVAAKRPRRERERKSIPSCFFFLPPLKKK